MSKKITKAMTFECSNWVSGSRKLTQKGYSVLKSALTPEQDSWIRSELTVKPIAPPPFDKDLKSFPVYFESTERIYLPRDWAQKHLGEPDSDTRAEGVSLREELAFNGKIRDEQLPIVNTFLASDANGLICVPCGYGKTFMAIWLALKLKKRFMVVVHKEFLLSQWRKELETLVPGIRLGIVQGPLCQIGPEYDAVLVMIQTLCSETRKYTSDLFNTFGFAIFDECHHLGAEYFSRSLLRIQCKHMLGLSATPQRADGLSKIFLWFLGPVAYQIKKRDADETVRVIAYRFEAADAAFKKPPVNWRGEIIRARLLNQIADYKPRTKYLTDRLVEFVKEGRKLLILSDRLGHLNDFEGEFKNAGITDIGYYIGGLKQAVLDLAEKKAVILATYAMAAEAMNIPSLNTILLATPKSNIEQSVGRILREKKEVRKFAPLILDVIDHQHHGCIGQYNHRRKFYKTCGYKVYVSNFGQTEIDFSSSSEEDNEIVHDDDKKPVGCLLQDE
jgi:superfamily II DNA or RNA helicase